MNVFSKCIFPRQCYLVQMRMPRRLNLILPRPALSRSGERFNIRWHRHTGAWHCLYLSLAEALNTIQSNGILHRV